MLALAAVFRAAIGEHAQQRNLVLFEERQDAVVEQIGGDQGGLAVVEFGEGDLGVGVEKRLLIDAAYALDGADIVRVLCAEIAGMRGLDLAVGFFLFASAFQGAQLIFGEHEMLLGRVGFQGLKSFAKSFQIVPQPDAAHSGWRNKQTAAGEFVGHAHLAEGWLVQGDLDHRFFDVFFDPVPRARFASADLAQGQLATGLVQLFEAVKAVAGIAHHLAGLRDATQQLAELQQPHFVLDDLLVFSSVLI